jgi:RNA polymerase sigma factor (sigma-70 family)
MDDHDLLSQFVQQQSHDAFATLVRRHIDLVYAACLRQTRNAHLAEDATQAVFLILSQRAGKLRPGIVLAGWLYNTARYAASNAIRAENRRKHYEQKAAQTMETVAPPSCCESDQALLTEMMPVLDDAVASLGSGDRNAVLLRFFENKSVKDVADTLGVSEVAAKKRVSRAVEKLRRFFTRRGVKVSGVGLVAILSGVPAQSAAPAALVTATTGLGGAAGSVAVSAATFSNISAIAKGTILMIQIKSSALVTASIVAFLLVSAGIFEIARMANADNRPAAGQSAIAPAASAPATSPAKLPAPDPQAEFNKLYSLKADEVLRRIVPPFPPQRAEVVLKPMFGGKLPDKDLSNFGAIVFYWVPPGKPQRRVSSTLPGNVALAIEDGLDLPHYKLEIPKAFYDQPLPGDWIVRMSAPLELRQQALEDILKTLPKPIRLEKHQLQRDVVVARGRYAFHSLAGIKEAQSIHVGPGDLLHLESDPTKSWEDEGNGGGSGSLKTLLAHVADKVDQYVIDETENPNARVEWRNHSGRVDDKDDNRDSLLWNLTQQTSLRFTREKRMVDIWTLSEQP